MTLARLSTLEATRSLRWGHQTQSPACADCGANPFCLSRPIAGGDLRNCRALVLRQREVDNGGLLYRAGESMRHVHVVNSGAFVRYCICPDGNEQVLGFYFPGEPLDFDEITASTRRSYAEALEPSTVCEIPAGEVLDRVAGREGMAGEMLSAVQHQIWLDRRRSCLVARGDARTRLAGFLLDLSQRMAQRGLAANELNLAMSRRNIASYLGLTIETVSRSLAALQRDGEIEVRGRNIRLNPSLTADGAA